MVAIPVTIANIFCVFYLPESPRWLLMKGELCYNSDIFFLFLTKYGVQLIVQSNYFFLLLFQISV